MMLRLTLVLSVLIALTLAGRGDRGEQTTEDPGRGGGGRGGGRRTTETPETTRGRGGGGRGGGRRTTEIPETTRGRGGGKGGGRRTTEMPETTRGRGGGGGGGKGGGDRDDLPDMGDMMRPDCVSRLPMDTEYLVLIQALFSNAGELIYTGADALEAYETLVSSEGTYRVFVRNPMMDLLNTMINDGFPDSLRFVLTLQDGSVIFDSSRGEMNTFERSQGDNNEDRINENHNSRIAILVAQMSVCGVGYEEKLSTSTGNREYYLAFRVFDRYASYGTVRVSYVLEDDDGGKGPKGSRLLLNN